jgi:glycosyltransferase involved in cell wall biosynthesis
MNTTEWPTEPLSISGAKRLQSAAEPVVTIGVPVYNGERYLAQCLDSLLAQTFRDFILLISDNASTDGTAQICQRYARQDPRVHYHRQQTNIGMYPNLNFLLRSARTRYVKLANADDFWVPAMLGEALAALERDPAVVLCHPRTVLVDANGAEIRRYDRHLNLVDDDPVARFERVLMELGLVNQLMGVIRVDAVRSALPLMSHTRADRVFLAELSLYGKILEIPDYHYFRRFHKTSSSWDRASEAHQIERVFSEGTQRIRFEAWKYHFGLFRRVLHSSLSYREKVGAIRLLVKQAVWDRSALLRECRQLFRVASAAAGHNSQREQRP